jgi:hypothetical protein
VIKLTAVDSAGAQMIRDQICKRWPWRRFRRRP